MAIKSIPNSVIVGITVNTLMYRGKPLFSTDSLGLSHHHLVGTDTSTERAVRGVLPKMSLSYALMARSRDGEFISQMGEIDTIRAGGSLDYVLGGYRAIVETQADKYSEVVIKAFRTGITGVKRAASDPTLVVQDQFTFLHVVLRHLRIEKLNEISQEQGKMIPHVILHNSLNSVYALATLVGPELVGGEWVESPMVQVYDHRVRKQVKRTFNVNVGGELQIVSNPNYELIRAFERNAVKKQEVQKPVETDTADVIETEEPF